MKYDECLQVLSPARLNRYAQTSGNEKVKTLRLYQYNIKLSQRFYGVIGMSEIMLRDAINTHYKQYFNYDNWIHLVSGLICLKDASCALMGTRFPVDGETVRLFLLWGKGLHAQHLDMDLSCRMALPEEKTNYCYYGDLTCHGAKHSGDIREIPEMVGTAEYIDLSLPELEAEGANYVTFTCNAYSYGALSPNLVVGWMNSACPMKISKITGVAYDPSCVQHMVRISEADLSKGLVFGGLDIAKREIIWLEMPFTSQIVHYADSKSIEALLRRLEEKISIGELLELKAKGQNLKLAESAVGVDEAYTYDWALNPAEVSRLLSA